MREWVKTFLSKWIGTDRIENFVLLALCVGVLITAAGFWVGVPCSKWPLWIGFAISFALLGLCEWRRVIGAAFFVIVCWLLTAWTFPYVGVDYQVCHAPLQRAFMNGWNPIFQSSVENLSAATEGGCWAFHALFIPHLCQLLGALVAKSTGLFLAESFLSYVLVYALWAAAYRFAQAEWLLGKIASVVFACVVSFPFAIFLIYIGAVDYPLYASLAFSLFSILNFERDARRADLFGAVVGLSLAIGIKASGAGIGIVGLCYLFFRHCRRIEVRRAVLISFVFVCLVNAAPTLTTWVRYASPLYPVHTFDPSIPLGNLTSDFTCNADAAQMGYFSRIVYAWFSKTLAIWGCAIISGNPDFNPCFGVPGGVAGLKELFKILMWCAVMALLMARKTRVTVVCLILFAISNMAPLKYIGYGRYFLLIWLIPPLAIFNLLANPTKLVAPLVRFGKWLPLMMFAGLFASVLAKDIAHYIRQAAIEGERQAAFSIVTSAGACPMPQDVRRRFLAHERLRLISNDAVAVFETNAVRMAFSDELMMPICAKIEGRDLGAEYPVCYKLRDYKRFRLIQALKIWPKPLWDRD